MTGDGTTKRLWLTVLSSGGYSTVAELCEVDRSLPRKRIDNLATQMAARGFLSRGTHSGRKNGVTYGVTLACKVPQGVTMRDLADARAIPQEAA